jgi:hypothetical protein
MQIASLLQQSVQVLSIFHKTVVGGQIQPAAKPPHRSRLKIAIVQVHRGHIGIAGVEHHRSPCGIKTMPLGIGALLHNTGRQMTAKHR